MGLPLGSQMFKLHSRLHGFYWNWKTMISIHLHLKNRLEWSCPRIASHDSNAILLHVSRNKERKPLDVIPVSVGVTKSQADRISSEFTQKGSAECADSGSSVDDNNF